MFDADLAILYEIETRALNQAVKRNADRFPSDFMFQITSKEYESLISQNVIAKSTGRGGRQKLPFVFTEQGVAMLSGVIRSKMAIGVNITIMRSFVQIRQMALHYAELANEIESLKSKMGAQFSQVYQVLDALVEAKRSQDTFEKRQRIGFKK